MNKEKEIETVTLMVRWYCRGVHGINFVRRAMYCRNTPSIGGTDARMGR